MLWWENTGDAAIGKHKKGPVECRKGGRDLNRTRTTELVKPQQGNEGLSLSAEACVSLSPEMKTPPVPARQRMQAPGERQIIALCTGRHLKDYYPQQIHDGGKWKINGVEKFLLLTPSSLERRSQWDGEDLGERTVSAHLISSLSHLLQMAARHPMGPSHFAESQPAWSPERCILL